MSQHRILDFSSSPYRLHTLHRQLVIEPTNASRQTVPLEDIAVLLVSHRQVSFTQSVMEELAEHGGILVVCNQKSLPVGIFSPLVNHSLIHKQLQQQIEAPEPLIHKAWQFVVRAKIRHQGQVLYKLHGEDYGLTAMSRMVKRGDPHNVEARAAQRYWKHLFDGMEGRTFRRKYNGDDFRNLCLNYGYGVLRAILARAICAVGFHPAIGIHHHNQTNGYCLADDLMEPFRPVVDVNVYRLVQTMTVQEKQTLTPEIKRTVIEPLLGRFNINGELVTLFDAALRLAQSLAHFFQRECKELYLPDSCDVYEEPKPF